MKRPGKPGEKIKLIAEPDDGFVFYRWSDGDLPNPNIYTFGEEDETLTAYFEPIETRDPVLTVNTVGGGKVRIESVEETLQPNTAEELQDMLNTLNNVTIDLRGRVLEGNFVCSGLNRYVMVQNGTLIGHDATETLRVDVKSSHWAFKNVTFLPSPELQWNLTSIGVDKDGQSVWRRAEDIPHNISFQGCTWDGKETRHLGNGCLVNGDNVEFIRCAIRNIKSPKEAHGINVYRCNGPILVEDCFIESSGINFFIGGGPPLPDVTPADVVVRGCWLHKPIEWFSDPGLMIKNHWEAKIGDRLVLSGNVFQNNLWNARGNQGRSIVITPRDRGSIAGVLVEENLVINSWGGVHLSNADSNDPLPEQLKDVTIGGNIFAGIGKSHFVFTAGESNNPIKGLLIISNTGCHNEPLKPNDSAMAIQIEPNGVFASGAAIEKNLLTPGFNGIHASGKSAGKGSLDSLPGLKLRGNVIPGVIPDMYPGGNDYPAIFPWVNYPTGQHASSQDVGADFTAVYEMAEQVRERWL